MKSIMTVEEVARYLGFSTKKIYRLVESNKIPASRIGRQYRFIREEVDRWLKDKSIVVTPDRDQRLDAVLERMRVKARRGRISATDIEQEIKKIRKGKSADT